MTGTCKFCGQSHALAGWLGRTEIAQACYCIMHALYDPNSEYQNEYIDWECVRDIATAYYWKDKSCTGGNLHVVLDDTNVDDRSLWWTHGFCDAKDDRDGSAIMSVLAELPVADRVRISREVGGRDGSPLPADWKPRWCDDS